MPHHRFSFRRPASTRSSHLYPGRVQREAHPQAPLGRPGPLLPCQHPRCRPRPAAPSGRAGCNVRVLGSGFLPFYQTDAATFFSRVWHQFTLEGEGEWGCTRGTGGAGRLPPGVRSLGVATPKTSEIFLLR